MVLSRTLQSQEPQAQFWSGCHPCKIYPKGDCLRQIHSHSPGCCTFQFHLWLLPLPDPALFPIWLLHLPDPSLSPKVVSPARSTLIPQGCVPCQIHPYPSRLLPLARSTFLPKSCWSCQIHFYSLRLSPARLTFILQGCCPFQIYLYS